MNRTLSRRLEYLETQALPASAPTYLCIDYVGDSGEVVETRVVELPRVIPGSKAVATNSYTQAAQC